MAVVGLKSKTWLNNDGLLVYFDNAQSTMNRGGEIHVVGSDKRITQVVIDLTDLPTVSSGDIQIVADNVFIPKGALIEKMDIITLTETTGTNANLDIGLVKQDRSTEFDFNGLLAAGDDFNGGTDLSKAYSYQAGTTDAGTKMGTVLTEDCLITANAETADWTAGVIRVDITWTKPLAADLAN